jgi:hypothetical protein
LRGRSAPSGRFSALVISPASEPPYVFGAATGCLYLHREMQSVPDTGDRLRRDQPSGKKTSNPLLGVVCLLTTGGLLCGRTCQALFIAFRTSCHTGPGGRSNGSVSPALCWWRRDPWSSLAPNALLSVVTALGHTPDPAGALGACEARGGQPLLRSGARYAPVPHNPCLAPRDLLALWDALARPRCVAHCACRAFSRLPEAPGGTQ